VTRDKGRKKGELERKTDTQVRREARAGNYGGHRR